MSNTAPPPDSGVAKASTAKSCSSKDVHLPRQAATDLPEPDSGTPAAAAQAPEVSDGSGLNRGLRNRHIQLIALGGAIGTGLFYGPPTRSGPQVRRSSCVTSLAEQSSTSSCVPWAR